MRLALCALAALAFSACTRHSDDTPEGPTPPADAPAQPPPAAPATSASQWAQDINAVGTEPFWGLEIAKDRMILSGPDRQDLVVTHGAPRITETSAVYEGSAGGVAVKVILTPGTCSDGMSDRTYPYVAEVQTGAETLEGCAAPKDATAPPASGPPRG
jgi:uncharacterized membrane protein